MKTAEEKRLEFRRNLETGTFMNAPGIYDALSAKIAEASGLNCLAMGGYAISATPSGSAGCRTAFAYRDAGIAEADL